MSGLRRTPIQRRTSIKRGTTPMRRTRINRMSDKRKAENAERREIPMKDYCEAHRAGMPGKCFGPLTKHEVLPRARGGSITDPANIKTVASECNRRLSQEVEAMRWALANDFLRHAWDDSKEAVA